MVLQQRTIANILQRQGVISPQALETLFEQLGEKPGDLLELALAQELATEEGIARALSAECGLEYVETIDPEAVPLEVAVRLPISYAKSQKVLLCAEFEEYFELICADPLNVSALDDVRALLDRPIQAKVASASVVTNAINRVYERQDTMGELESEGGIQEDQQADLLDSDDDAPIIRWVNALFAQAVKERTSDIHIEPEEKEVVVRYRVDGELYVARRGQSSVHECCGCACKNHGRAQHR